MKLAYFSPMRPARTGIATYSRELAKALRRRCEVTVFTQTENADPVEGVEIFDFFHDPSVLKSLGGFDRILYHVGNNPWYHLEILKALTLFPGAVCLHDVVIYYLAAGLGKGGLLKELLLDDPENAFRDLKRIEEESPGGDLLRYPTASKHPCVRGLLESTPHVIVHNETSANAVRALGYAGHVDVIPLLHYGDEQVPPSREESQKMRSSLGYGESDVVFGAFGFIGPTKRLDKVLHALALLKDRGKASKLRLLIVGEGADSLNEMIRELGLETIVKKTGFVADDQFQTYLSALDALVNLRYPSNGESSASLIQAMSYGKPCVVTDDASFSELPDGTVLKVGFNGAEIEDIARVMEEVLSQPARARKVGKAARAYILANHAPDAVAARFVEALGAAQPRVAQGPAAEQLPPGSSTFSPTAFLQGRAQKLVP